MFNNKKKNAAISAAGKKICLTNLVTIEGMENYENFPSIVLVEELVVDSISSSTKKKCIITPITSLIASALDENGDTFIVISRKFTKLPIKQQKALIIMEFAKICEDPLTKRHIYPDGVASFSTDQLIDGTIASVEAIGARATAKASKKASRYLNRGLNKASKRVSKECSRVAKAADVKAEAKEATAEDDDDFDKEAATATA